MILNLPTFFKDGKIKIKAKVLKVKTSLKLGNKTFYKMTKKVIYKGKVKSKIASKSMKVFLKRK